MTGSSGSLYGAASALGRSLFNDAEAAPLMNAAGTVKTLGHVRSLLRSPLPAIMMGSFTRDERLGNDGRTYFDADIATLNSMGLPGPSCGVWADWVSEAVAEAHDCGKELWVSVAGFDLRRDRVTGTVVADASQRRTADRNLTFRLRSRRGAESAMNGCRRSYSIRRFSVRGPIGVSPLDSPHSSAPTASLLGPRS